MVKCSDCGYLAVIENGSESWREAGEATRSSGHVDNNAWRSYPACFRRLADIQTESQSQGGQGRPAKIKAVLDTERECDGFRQWVTGYSPKEHHEMEVQAQIREWQSAREVADRDWRAAQAELDRLFRREESRKDRTWRILEAVIATVLLVGATLAGAFIARTGGG